MVTKNTKYPGADTSRERLEQIAKDLPEKPKHVTYFAVHNNAIFDLLAMIEERDQRIAAVLEFYDEGRGVGIIPVMEELRK